MFKEAFIKLDPIQAARMTETINPFLDMTFDPATTSVMIHDLSFYEGYFLVELSRHSDHPSVVRTAICDDKGNVTVLNWTKDPIYALNKSVPIRLTPETMPDYLRFYFAYVRGAHGRFLIVDSVDDIDWREEPSASGRKALGRMIEPLHMKRPEKNGIVVFSVCIVFMDSLYQAEAHVAPDGTISLQNQEILVEDIPVADDLFGQ